ncbi:hypothetical protein EM868_19030 [Cupriavidus gilardii]|uniref:hypothetical protein n=1 Tax=Cupriavidus gilardii TaxID=82541 RepID=UPI001EE5864B|nr:hypothetical protein [Cupriavidus gilardii]MDF9431871.1 hypothetical protein [Cupriavidus gilardii]
MPMPHAGLARLTLAPGLAPALALALALSASPPARAYVDHYLASTVVGTMTQSEARAFAAAVNRALNATEDGTAVSWRTQATPRRAATYARITPLQSRTDHGQPCRQIRSELKRSSNEESWTGWFCKQPDGRWRARVVEEE